MTLHTELNKLIATGGYVSELTLYLARKYPIAYTLETKEVINQRKYDLINKKEKDLEQIYMEVQKEFEMRERSQQKSRRPSTRRSMADKEVSKLHLGKDINEAIENSPDPSMIECLLTPNQIQAVQDYKR